MTIKEKLRRDQSIDNLVMEDAMRRSGHDRGLAMEEKQAADNSWGGDESAGCRDEVGSKRAYHETEDLNSSLSENNKDLSNTKQMIAASEKEKPTMESDSKPLYSSQKDQDNKLESARAEMGEVREENQRLKMYLSQMMKDYQALQSQFYEIMQQKQAKNHQEVEEPELVSLSLGRFSSESKKDGKSKNFSQLGKEEDEKANDGGLSLGLECKFEVSKYQANEADSQNPSTINSFDEPKEEEAGETWPPKAPKIMPSGEDEFVQQNPLKKARVSVRARCDTPTMNDGCQWRKYGQKIAKGNPCPRAYYRCTIAPSCPVRKQVQRCADDMSILITTYEGTHNHPLPLAATAVASTTSAAASMLLSGSSSSSTSRTGPHPSATARTIPADLHGLNFYLSDHSNSKQFYFHNPSLSASPSHPTITLDLTSNPSSSPFNRFSSSTYPPNPKLAPTSLNFSSAESNSIPWGNGFLSYGSSTSQSYNRNQHGALNISRPPLENSLFQSYMQKKTPPIPQQDTIAAATKAITADPSFQSALAAALTSIIGTGGGGGGGANLSNVDSFAQKLKWGEHFPLASGYSSPTPKGNACATSFLNKTTTNFQAGSLMFLPPSLPFSSPKSSASASPGDNRDHNN